MALRRLCCASVLMLFACSAPYAEGIIACETASDCPSGWACETRDAVPLRCYKHASDAGGVDASDASDTGVDADTNDAMVLSGCDLDPCDENAFCHESSGTVVCTCESGFEGTGETCTDIDECLVNNGGCDALVTCTNNVGAAVTCGGPVGPVGPVRVSGGLVSVGSATATGSVRLRDHGFEYAPRSCGTNGNQNVCVTGGLRP